MRSFGYHRAMEPTGMADQTETQGQTSHVEPEGMLPVIREHIVKTPGTCWGKPRIAGTRIKVEQVVIWHERMGMRPEEIGSTSMSTATRTLPRVFVATASTLRPPPKWSLW